MLTERSGKGGLHSIQTQLNGVILQGMAIRAKTALECYFGANLSHDFYFSRWERQTRAPTGLEPGEALFGASTANFAAIHPAGPATLNWAPRPNAYPERLIGSFTEPSGAGWTANTGNRFGCHGWRGNTNSLAINPPVRPSVHGPITPWASNATYVNKAASRIVYRLYWEDLTVSGRSYAQVQAADYELWQAAFAAGGRYAGDTFSNPLTAVP